MTSIPKRRSTTSGSVLANRWVLSGLLSEHVGRQISPLEFWEHPTVNALASFLTGSESDDDEQATAAHHRPMDDMNRRRRSRLPFSR